MFLFPFPSWIRHYVSSGMMMEKCIWKRILFRSRIVEFVVEITEDNMTFTLKCCALNLVNWYAVVKLFLFFVGRIGIDRDFADEIKLKWLVECQLCALFCIFMRIPRQIDFNFLFTHFAGAGMWMCLSGGCACVFDTLYVLNHIFGISGSCCTHFQWQFDLTHRCMFLLISKTLDIIYANTFTKQQR